MKGLKIFSFLLIALLSAQSLRARGLDLGSLTPAEVEYLAENAPSFSTTVKSGAVLAYGNFIRPPLLLTIFGARVLINGVEVFPRQKRDPDFRARKLRGLVQEQHYLDRRRKAPDALEGARGRADRIRKRLGADVTIAKRQGRQGESQWVELSVGKERSSAPIDACPPALSQKENFILTTLLQQHLLMKRQGDRAAATKWLEDRLTERKEGGALDWYKIPSGDGALETRLSCDRFPTNLAIRNSVDRGPEYEKLRLARVEAAERERKRILAALKNGRLLLFSFGLDKEVVADAGLLEALEKASHGDVDEVALTRIREGLQLEPAQAKELLDEVERP